MILTSTLVWVFATFSILVVFLIRDLSALFGDDLTMETFLETALVETLTVLRTFLFGISDLCNKFIKNLGIKLGYIKKF